MREGQDAEPAERRSLLAQRLARRNLDAWMLVPGPNLMYFTGIAAEPSERVFLYIEPAAGAPVAVVPRFEVARVERALGGAAGLAVLGYGDETGPEPALARALAPFGSRAANFGAEFGGMRLREWAAVEGAVPRARWHPLEADLAALRQIKEGREVAALRRAAAIAAQAAARGAAAALPGASEWDVEAACREVLHAHRVGAPFPVMVASGPASADPHAATSARRLAAGEVCWIDVGAVVDGYCADVTRTVVVPGAAADADLVRALQVATRAQAAAIGAVRPGTTAAAIDAVARATIVEAGLGAYFLHRTGHGLGLAEHEPPYIVDGNEEPLQVGMVFTVEPGIYLPGKGGVRVEDDVLVTATGAEVLTRPAGSPPAPPRVEGV